MFQIYPYLLPNASLDIVKCTSNYYKLLLYMSLVTSKYQNILIYYQIFTNYLYTLSKITIKYVHKLLPKCPQLCPNKFLASSV